jgi:hypothetical protein
LCLEAGFATNRRRLWCVSAEPLDVCADDRQGRLRIHGFDWPWLVFLDVKPTWTVTDLRPAPVSQVRRFLGRGFPNNLNLVAC